MMRGQPVGGASSCCAPSAPIVAQKAVRMNVYVPVSLFSRLERIAQEYDVSVQRVLLLAGQLCDHHQLREYLDDMSKE